jgi:molybdopterin adenylyltransferase
VRVAAENQLKFGILTISDRAAQGIREDASGPALADFVRSRGWEASASAVIPDDFMEIQRALLDWCTTAEVDIILTTGGTGFSSRDVTPEATLAVIERPAPGLSEAMRQASLRVTPHAMLSRAAAGIRGQILIINLPGSPKAAVENLQVVADVLPHAVQLLNDDPNSEAGHTRLA